MKDWLSERVRRVPRRTMMIGLTCGGAAIGVGGLAAMRRFFPYFAFDPAVRVARSRAKPHIDKADNESLADIDVSLESLRMFFEVAKGHCDAFADDVLGWYSKYKLIRGKHESFLADTFQKHFFGPESLKQAMMNAVETYVADLDAIDNRMLVDVRLDVADLPVAVSFSSAPIPELQARYKAECGRISGVAAADGAVEVGKLVADMIVTAVIGMIAARLAASGVVLATGTAAGWWTFGIGLVVGVIVDQVISAVWDWTYDPRGKLIAMMENQIDEVRTLVIEGDAGKPGLRKEMQRYAEKRAVARREAMLALLQ